MAAPRPETTAISIGSNYGLAETGTVVNVTLTRLRWPQTMIERALALAGIAIAIISLVLATVFPTINKRVAWAGLIFGILLLGVAGGIAIFPNGQAQQPSSVNQGPGSAFSYGQQGGVTAGTVNIGPVPRRIPQADAAVISAALVQKNPSGTIEVQTDMMGCPDCDSLATQFEKLLKSAPKLIVKPVRNGMTGLRFRGVALTVRDENSLPESVQLVKEAFQSAGIKLQTIQGVPSYPDSDAVLIVAQPIM